MSFLKGKIPQFRRVAAALMRFRNSSRYCDVTLNVGGVQFPAHKVILSMFSPYFEAMFSGKFPESEESTITLHDMDPDAFRIAFDYIYTGKVQYENSLILEVFQIADYLQVESLKTKCRDYIKEIITVEESVPIIKLADLYNLSDILEKALNVFYENLEKSSLTIGFLSLDIDDIVKLFDIVDPTDDEMTRILEAILRWVKYDLDGRKSYTGRLLELIPVRCVSRAILDKYILKDSLFSKEASATDWILSNFPVLKDLPRADDAPDDGHGMYIPTKFRKIFITTQANEFASFDVVSKNFQRLASVPCLKDFKPATYGDSIYLFGGVRSQSAWTYNINDEQWKTIPFPMYSSTEAICVLDDSVFFTGGLFSETGYNSVHRYDFNGGQMLKYPKFNVERSMHGVVAHDQCIYVCGGKHYRSTNSAELRLVERMDIREGKWSLLRPMKFVQGYCTAVLLDDSVYCSDFLTGTTERYDWRASKWEILQQAPSGSGSIVCFDQRLYRMSTFGAAEYVSQLNVWQRLEKCAYEYPLAVAFNS